MNPAKLLIHPLFAATVGLGLAISWASAYYSASEQAREAGASMRPFTELARVQLADVGACEGSSASDLEPTAEAAARRRAFDCAAPYLLAQPVISAPAATQALGYAAGAAHREVASPRGSAPAPALFYKLASAAERDARSATKVAEAADARMARACSGFLAAPACSLSGLAPDRPDRRMADSMREFEVDLRAQRHIVEAPAQEAAYRVRASARDPEGRFSPAYIQARREVGALIAPAR